MAELHKTAKENRVSLYTYKELALCGMAERRQKECHQGPKGKRAVLACMRWKGESHVTEMERDGVSYLGARRHVQ